MQNIARHLQFLALYCTPSKNLTAHLWICAFAVDNCSPELSRYTSIAFRDIWSQKELEELQDRIFGHQLVPMLYHDLGETSFQKEQVEQDQQTTPPPAQHLNASWRIHHY